MRRRSAILAAVGLLALAFAPRALAEPSLEFSPSGCDFGELGAVELAERAIVVRNIGPAPVRIISVRACCGAKATVSAGEVAPSGNVELRVSVTTGTRPGPFRKTVTVISDDPGRPMAALALTGSVRRTVPSVLGDEVVLVDATAARDASQEPSSAPAEAKLSLSVPAVVLAGVVDGFNPCSFAIVVSLAGILAIGGRRRRARILGGLSFCAGSFVTYMLMGFGLLQALRVLEGMRLAHAILMAVLAASLFVLSFLSFRDAFRFHRVPVFSVVTLKLPEGVKILIRRIALSSWSGPAVVAAGFGCAFVVTLLDALCTGQVYVPVLALLAKESGSARAFALLVLYNLAFIAPLVAVFVIASRTTDAFQMARWSSRNVVPAKIALGLVFALLGWMLWPKLSSVAEVPSADGARPVGSAVSPAAPGNAAFAGRESAPAEKGERMSAAELAAGNERLDAFLREPQLDPAFPKMLAAAVADEGRDGQWRNHCLQFVPECMLRLGEASADRALLASVLEKALADRSGVLAGTALLGYSRLSERIGEPTPDEVGAMAAAIASDASSAPENIVTALRVGTELGDRSMLAPARYWARHGTGEFVRCVAISAVRDLAGSAESAFLRSLLPARTKAEENVVKNALRKLESVR